MALGLGVEESLNRHLFEIDFVIEIRKWRGGGGGSSSSSRLLWGGCAAEQNGIFTQRTGEHVGGKGRASRKVNSIGVMRRWLNSSVARTIDSAGDCSKWRDGVHDGRCGRINGAALLLE